MRMIKRLVQGVQITRFMLRIVVNIIRWKKEWKNIYMRCSVRNWRRRKKRNNLKEGKNNIGKVLLIMIKMTNRSRLLSLLTFHLIPPPAPHAILHSYKHHSLDVSAYYKFFISLSIYQFFSPSLSIIVLCIG